MLTVLAGDALTQLRTLDNESVQCCVTSPPYWGLRDYGTAKWNGGQDECDHLGPPMRTNNKPSDSAATFHGGGSRAFEPWPRGECGKCGARRIDSQIGLEKTPQEYVEKIVAVMREVRRVLKKDGTLWLNLGDSYAGSGCGWGGGSLSEASNHHAKVHGQENPRRSKDQTPPPGLKQKDLCGIPWRVAFALQQDGWYLRSDIIWAKPNPMPESVSDRPTKAHEYIFLLTKSAHYFYDGEAIKEKGCDEPGTHRGGSTLKMVNGSLSGDKVAWHNHSGGIESLLATGTRNKRSVWTIPTNPYPDAHFATFPPELPKLCILAGTSARGCCSNCGAPWERQLERVSTGKSYAVGKSDTKRSDGLITAFSGYDDGSSCPSFKTTGWQPTCSCNAEITPCTVLDPFAGSGTSGQVALELARKAILIELNPSYCQLIEQRCSTTLGLPLA